MKKKLLLMGIAGVLVMTAVVGGTLAGFNTGTGQKGVADITVKDLGISLTGNGQAADTLETASISTPGAVPGGEVEVTHRIENTIEGGYDVYVRATIDKKWNDDSLDPEKIIIKMDDKELEEGEEPVNDWIVWYKDAEQIIMYYTKPVAYGDSTTELIESVAFSTDMDNAYAGAEVDLMISADAIQTIAAADAMPSEWGVYPVFDDEGSITAVEE